MMNIGETPVLSTHGVVTSLAWGMQGKVSYVLEGNINFEGILRELEDGSVCKYILVEQDICRTSPFDCLQKSYENLAGLGYR